MDYTLKRGPRRIPHTLRNRMSPLIGWQNHVHSRKRPGITNH